MRALLAIGLIVVPLVLAESHAGPVCDAVRAGALACLAGRVCVCRFERGGSIAGRPDGHRWDCGALRPNCTPAPAGVPADLEALAEPAPPLEAPRWRDR